MGKLDFIFKRHSVRKFKEEDVPQEDIRKIIEAAASAPSGKNKQNWHFVILKNREKIEQVAEIIKKKNEEVASLTQDEEKRRRFTKYLKYGIHFTSAPVLILIYAGDYPTTGLDILQEGGASLAEQEKLSKPAPGIQGIGAAIENLMLAAAELGYGTCWMTSQNYAAGEIEEYIGYKQEGYFLAAITPLGVPAEEPKSPPKKSVDEVMTVIE